MSFIDCGAGDVVRDGQGLAAQRLDLVDDRLQMRLVEVVDHHVGAGLGQSDRDGTSQTAARRRSRSRPCLLDRTSDLLSYRERRDACSRLSRAQEQLELRQQQAVLLLEDLLARPAAVVVPALARLDAQFTLLDLLHEQSATARWRCSVPGTPAPIPSRRCRGRSCRPLPWDPGRRTGNRCWT